MKLEIEGMKEAKKLLNKVGKGASEVIGVQLNAKKRKETGSSLNNRDILNFLKAQHRNFQDLNQQQIDMVEKAIVTELKRKWNRLSFKNINSVAKNITALVASALTKGMEEYSRIIGEMIDKGVDANGNKLSQTADLSPEYKDQKQKKHGYVYPIGKATGQLRANVTNTKDNIELIKK